MRQWFCWASRETPNKTTVASITPLRNVCTFSASTCRATQSHCRATQSHSKPPVQPLKPLKATLRFPNATVEPLRATQRIHREPLKKLRKATKSHRAPHRATEKSCSFLKIPSSRVTGVQLLHVRGDRCPLVPRPRFLLAHRSWSRGCIGQLFNLRAHRKQQHTHHGSQRTCYTPIVAHKKHGHTHRSTATVPLILPAHVVQSCW